MPRTRGKVNEIHARYISRSASGKQSNNHEKDSLLSPPGLGYRNVEIRESEVNSLPRTALSGLASGSPVWMAPRSEQTNVSSVKDLLRSFREYIPLASFSLISTMDIVFFDLKRTKNSFSVQIQPARVNPKKS
ncbi:hypothetical protein LENED_001989 [Lentinula edodes]|uniref:Uncharacterized protein n=1 Tax=Lentinula edodes TaxID=5353 RepID=A0A1Q3DZM2_LENED|nr:hypothetical protein LENED_001989 [Lentinula edodes]